MDGTGRDQDLDQPTGHPLPDNARVDDVPETLQAQKGGENSDGDTGLGGGRLAKAEGQQAVRHQAVVSPDDYSGSSESGV